MSKYNRFVGLLGGKNGHKEEKDPLSGSKDYEKGSLIFDGHDLTVITNVADISWFYNDFHRESHGYVIPARQGSLARHNVIKQMNIFYVPKRTMIFSWIKI